MTHSNGTAERQVGLPPLPSAEERALNRLYRDVREIQRLVFNGENPMAAVYLERLAVRIEDKLNQATLERQSQ